MRAVEWGSPNWGQPGHNVHEDPFGSFVPNAPKEES